MSANKESAARWVGLTDTLLPQKCLNLHRGIGPRGPRERPYLASSAGLKKPRFPGSIRKVR
jgi:hypothetical protein